MRLLTIIPDYSPPETLSHYLKQRIDPHLNQYSHVAVIDRDVKVPEDFYGLPFQYPDCDLIGVEVKPSSLWHRLWERTYRVKLAPRIRGCATIYSTSFLRRVGGWPLVITPDTWLLNKAQTIITTPITVIHEQPLSLKHSLKGQLRDGRSRAQLHYPLWKTVLHSIFRLRPLVLAGYIERRVHDWWGEYEFGHPW